MEGYEKWNNYEIGKVSWINDRRDHVSRKLFTDYVAKNNINKVLEIGGGEVIEAQTIRETSPHVDYNILDVSDTFLANAKSLGFKTFQGTMIDPPFGNKEFDVVYMASVLEHTPSIKKTAKELKRISNRFFITMFKWRMKKGGLQSNWQKKKGFYSTEFGIQNVFDLLGEHGVIDQKVIATKDGKLIPYDEYIKGLDKGMITHRNGNYLSIIGRFNED